MNKLETTKYRLDIQSTLDLLKKVPVDWNNQLAVTSRNGEDLLDGIGSIRDYPANTERDFSVLNSYFKGSDIERLLNQLYQDGYSHGRVRIMRLYSKSVYSYHMDCEPRLHFALKTNPSSMFIIDDEVFRVPSDGKGYLMNTTLLHTALNCAETERIHLVIDLLIPVTRIHKFYNTEYKLLNKTLTQFEFDKWLIETKPHTEPKRMDYYFTEDIYESPKMD